MLRAYISAVPSAVALTLFGAAIWNWTSIIEALVLASRGW